MPGTAVIVFTGQNVDTMLKQGGSSCWILNRSRAEKCEYVICTWNANLRLRPLQNAAHRAAFLIGKVWGVVPCKRTARLGRKLREGNKLQFKEYALINVPNVYPGYQNPVTYADDAEHLLGMTLASVAWRV